MPNALERVKVNTATTGTGTVTLGSAVTRFRTFADAGAQDGVVYSYLIEEGNGWEIGRGVYTASGTTLSRNVVKSSNSDALLNLGGNATVACIIAAHDVAYSGARVKKSADQTGANYSGGVTVAWDAETFDTDGFHDNVTNNSRLTPPSGRGINFVRLSAHFRGENHTSGTYVGVYIYNSAAVVIATQRVELTATSIRVTVETGVIPHADGDYYQCSFETESDTSIDVTAAQSYFAIEVVG